MLEYIHDLKGVTVYVDGTKKDQPITAISKSEAKKFLAENNIKTEMDEAAIQCGEGTCEV